MAIAWADLAGQKLSEIVKTMLYSSRRLSPYVEPIPAHVIIHPAASFLGLRRLSEKASERRAALLAKPGDWRR
jgi:hypothetical protein